VDRNRAKENVEAALVAASIAIGSFGLTFFIAIIYIG
jgi:hypothetical protein